MRTIGQNLKFLLDKHNKRQSSLARFLGISPSRLSNYINDSREPDLELLSKMAKYLKVDLNYFGNDDYGQVDMPHKPDNEVVKVPCMFINNNSIPLGYKHLKLDSSLLKNITDPLVIEVKRDGYGLRAGSYILASKMGEVELEGTKIIETGRNYKVYHYVASDSAALLVNLSSMRASEIEQNKTYYAVKWILQ